MRQDDTATPVQLQQSRLFDTALPVADNCLMTLGDRIKQTRERIGMSQAALAEAAGMRQQSLSALESGKTLSTTKLVSLAEALKVSASWLARGDDNGPADRLAAQGDDPVTTSSRVVENERMEHSLDEWLATQGVAAGKLYVWVNRGAAMEPTLHDGDSVAVDYEDGQIVGGEIIDGGVYMIGREVAPTKTIMRFRRLRETAAGDLVIISDNPDKGRFPDETVPADRRSELIILGRVLYRAGRVR